MFSDLFPELVGFVPGVGFVKFLTEGEDVVLLGGGSGGAGIGGLFLWLLIKFVRVLLVTVVTKGGLAIERSEAWCCSPHGEGHHSSGYHMAGDDLEHLQSRSNDCSMLQREQEGR